MNNPLLGTDGLPAFSLIKPEHIEPAIDYLLKPVDKDDLDGPSL